MWKVTSIVIPYRLSINNDQELRFCLRSIVMHLKGYGEIFIIGEKPTWVKNVTHIPTPDIDRQFDKTYWKERKIYEKIRIAAYMDDVTDDFYFTNDDHFLLQDFDAATFPLHWGGDMSGEICRPDIYGQTCIHTNERIRANMWPDHNYDTHCPIVYNKRLFQNLEELDWTKKWGYCIKTMYCGINGKKGEFYPDLKIKDQESPEMIKRLIANRPYFSIGDKAVGPGMLQVLRELYPDRSIYEAK